MSEDSDGGADREDERETVPDRADGDDASGGETDDAEPLSELAERINRSRQEREGESAESDPFAALEREAGDEGATASTAGEAGDGAGDDPFERMDVETIDQETVWESLEADAEGETIDGAAAGVGVEAERVERDDPGAERPDHVVEKDAYCQRCRFLSTPPEVRCTHDGTEIVEVVDSERFRVRGCPMATREGALDGDTDDA